MGRGLLLNPFNLPGFLNLEKCFAPRSPSPPLATFHYNFSIPPSFSRDPNGIKLPFGLVSIRRSTKGIQPQDGRTGFGAPHVKPFVRPSLFFQNLPTAAAVPHKGIFCRFYSRNVAESGGARQSFTAPTLV